ncbi:T9SS type A sorting domain-containing protein [candidate division WOR-3 bacterium]|nr:T9SS type A sorting domain-containing protein [candidate division WOR-3 bacterium]
MVYNPTNNKVYCANAWDTNVTVIDGATNAIITAITVGDGPCALVYNPTNNKVYCANYGSDNVAVIDGATNAVITTITVGDYPGALVYNPTNNDVYCANESSDNVTVIDGATNAVITTIGVGDLPRAFAWNYVQNRTYVANYYGSSISVLRNVTGIEEEPKEEVFCLSQCYPNPFMDKTKIEYTLPKISNVNIAVYNVLGARVKSLLNDKQNAGIYTITWDGRDKNGNKLPSGFYFLRLEAGEYKGTRKLLLIR